MTEAGALFAFFSQFGIDAYPSSAIPENPKLPYLTYEANIGNYGDRLSSSAKLWYHTSSEAEINKKVSEIARTIGLGGVQIPHDEGTIWINRGTPWSTPIPMEDASDKGRLLNLMFDFN